MRRRELIHQRDKLTKLQAALEVEERRASELIVAAGGPAPAHMVVLSPNMNTHTEKSATRKVQAEHYDCNSEVERDWKQEEDGTDIDDDDEDLEATFGDVDMALAKVAHLDACGVSAHLAKLLYTKPWCEEAMAAAIVEVVILEWQARKVVGCDNWTCPTRCPDVLFDDASTSHLAVPVAPILRRSSAAKFPQTLHLLNYHEPRAAYTDERGKKHYSDLADASVLPGRCWQWLGGWRLETDDGDGWVYGDCEQLILSIFSSNELDLDGTAIPEAKAFLRCRKWHRVRALIKPPSPSLVSDPRSSKRNQRAHLVALKYLQLRCHLASVTALAAKLSDQLVATRAALTGVACKVAQVPAVKESCQIHSTTQST